MKLALALTALLAGGAAGIPDGDVRRGEQVYGKCYGCHSLEPGQTANGPSLHAIVGKPIAADPDFRYSEALRALAQRERLWSPQLLERFIADPEAVAPGTDMSLFMRTVAQERADLIAYLATHR